ncbi:MAG: 4-hydroxy-tetrahydrodipicolinate synthase [Candidatus Altiarchaeales archaeon]|nr:4-hydroxy-tetrahydrodipicolinate synthase [Candidatus Altiarchaeales archaeon]
MNSVYTGCWSALVTTFKEDYTIDWDEFQRLIEFQVEEGITGVLPMGTTGESATVTHDEHSQVIEKTVEYAEGDCMVLAGTGSNSTEEALHETQLAQDVEVDACLLVDCYYNKPSSIMLKEEYYTPILAKYSDMDFIAYAIPGRSVTVLAPEDLALLRHSFQNLVAVKEATGDFDRMRLTRSLVDDDFNIISGDDPNTYTMMSETLICSSGVISVISNICPQAIEDMTRLLLAGEKEKAKEIDDALSPLFEVVGVKTVEDVTLPTGDIARVKYSHPNPVPIKTMMRGLGMISQGCKRPLGLLPDSGVNKVRKALREVWDTDQKYLQPIEGFFDVDLEDRLTQDKYWSGLSY